jgi:hypothetical protein
LITPPPSLRFRSRTGRGLTVLLRIFQEMQGLHI